LVEAMRLPFARVSSEINRACRVGRKIDERMTVLLAGLAALSIGTSDVFGAVAVRKGRLWATVMWIFGISGVVMAVVASLAGGEPTTGDLALGGLAGVASGLALLALYRGYELSELGIVGPTAGIVGAIVPVAVGFALDGAPSLLVVFGMLLGLAAVGLIGWSPSRPDLDTTARKLGVLFGIAAGMSFGIMALGLGLLTDDAGMWPAVVTRISSSSTVLVIAIALHRPLTPAKGTLPNIAIAGAAAAFGIMFYVLAAQRDLAVAGLLIQMGYAVSVVSAVVLFGERSLPTQRLGFAIAAASVALITLG
jgi:drug/metabolite transporter (DMT)-like permease